MRTPSLFRRAVWLPMISAAGLSLMACAMVPSKSDPAPDPYPSELTVLADRVRVLEESLPLLACGPELRALIQDARQLCSEKTAPQSKAEAGSGGECNEKVMKVALATAERDMETKSVGQKLLSVLRHEVAYLTADGKLSAKRERRLKSLARERLLPSTRFLLVAGGPDSAHRIELMTDRLRSYGIKDTEIVTEGGEEKMVRRFERPWNLRLNIPLLQIPLVDRPVPPAEPRDLDQAVFVFRTDCL